MNAHILVVEDDMTARIALVSWLSHAGYRITEAADGETAIELLEQGTFEVVLADILLGNLNGLDVLQAARRQPYHPEVILLTGQGTLQSSIEALRKGAYDYLLKPCPPEQLVSSVEGALKRHKTELQLREATSSMISAIYGEQASPQEWTPPRNTTTVASDQPLQVGKLVIGTTRHEVWFDDKRVPLTPIEFGFLRFLAERLGTVCRGSDIIRYTHGVNTSDADAQAILRSHVRNIRKKIAPGYLFNDRGVGYRLVAPEEEVAETT